jgi:hypothetical protein
VIETLTNKNMEPTPTIEGKLEVVEPSALEAITKAEVDLQISTAKRYPRSLTEFKRQALSLATISEEAAASCIYKLTRKDNKTNSIKVIEGESIRLAEIVAASYGNLRSGAQVTSQTPTRVTCRSFCWDLQNNNMIALEKQAKTAYHDGRPYSEDLSILITNATISKALRDAIFRIVPRAIVAGIVEECKRVAVGTAETLNIRRGKAMTWVKSLGIDVARVYNVLRIKGEADIGLEQLELLTGLRTAIRDADQSVDEAFPVITTAEPVPTLGPDAALGAAGLAPVVPAVRRGGRPVGSKNKPKEVTPAVVVTPPVPATPVVGIMQVTPTTPPPVPENAPEANVGADSAFSEGDAQAILADFCKQEVISFEDFTDWAASTGRLEDAKSFPDFASLPDKFCQPLVTDAAALGRCAKIFGHRGE